MKRINMLLEDDFYKEIKKHADSTGKTLTGMVKVGLKHQLEVSK